MRLARDLALAVEGVPDGGSVTLPVTWLRERLRLDGPEENVVVDLTVEQAAKKLGRSPSTVRNWLAAEEIPGAYRFKGREWRIPPSALERFLDKQRTAPQATATTVGARALALDEWRKHLANDEEE